MGDFFLLTFLTLFDPLTAIGVPGARSVGGGWLVKALTSVTSALRHIRIGEIIFTKISKSHSKFGKVFMGVPELPTPLLLTLHP
jgi:hypothetical protein